MLFLRSFPSPIICFTALLALVVSASISTSETNDRKPGTFPDKISSHAGRIDGVAFSPDGLDAASASHDGTARVWDVATRRPTAIAISGISGFTGIAWSPDGRMLASTGLDGRVALCDLPSGRVVRSFPANETDGSVRVGVFSPDGGSLVTGGDDRAIHVWDVPTGRERLALRGHDAMVRGLVYTPDGKAILSISADGRAISWDARTGQIRDQVDGECGPLWSVAVSRDGRWAALGGKDGITLRDLESGRARSQRCFQGPITSVAFLPGGTILVSAGLEGAITLWKLEQGDLRRWRTLDGQEGRVKAMAVSPDGKTLVTGGDDAILRFWQIQAHIQN